jgi:ribulose-5-phosphate 4-epimerase/fuculose-1-phosphate aldolase
MEEQPMATAIETAQQAGPKPKPMSEAEWQARLELAACYRVFDRLGWVELIFNHITLRVPDEPEHLLINPFGLLYREVTASNLVKIDLEGNILSDSEWPINAAGLLIHSYVHAARPDTHCVMHTHTTTGTGVACLRDGLDPNNFYSAQLHGKVAYHAFEGITVEPDEGPRLVCNLGDRNLMILRNHGLLALGPTLPAAFSALWTLQRACDVQMAAQSTGRPLEPVTEEAALRSTREAFQFSDRTSEGQTLFAAMRRTIDSTDPTYAR